MCCGFAFWKRAVVFGLTFTFGVFLTSVFYLRPATPELCPADKKELPAENRNAARPSVADAKNCVPAEDDLKYERLTIVEDKRAVKEKKQADEKASLKAEKEKRDNRAAPQPYNPSTDSAEYKTLLYREKCFESEKPK